MTDIELNESWTSLEPTSQVRQRIQSSLQADLEAHDTSLAAEWLSLLRIAPLKTLGLGAVSTLALAASLAWVAVKPRS